MMKPTIARPLFAAIAGVVLLVIALLSLLFYASLERGFDTYARETELRLLDRVAHALVYRYRESGGWGFLAGGGQLMPAIEPYIRFHPEFARPDSGADVVQDGEETPNPAGPNAGQDPNRDPRRELWELNLPADPGAPLPPGPGGPPPGGPPPGWSQGFPPPGGPPPGIPPAPRDPLALGDRVALLDPEGHFVAGNRAAAPEPRRALVVGEGAQRQVVGYLVLTAPRMRVAAGGEFARRQAGEIAGIALLALLVAAGAAWLTARHFRRPIRALAEAIHRVAGGDLGVRVAEERRDELGTIAQDFNQMARTLESFESARRQWVADSSHELRTPITILGTHLEAMRDGVLPTNPEKLEALAHTVEGMARLVADLHQLARADAGIQEYHFEPVEVAGLLDELEEGFAPRLAAQGLVLSVYCRAPAGTLVQGDRLRLNQILGNLLTNSGRYTDEGGEVRLSSQLVDGQVELAVEDSAPGVPEEALPRLFDRFYRVDPSRSRRLGGSGLGLAICRTLVAAHGGEIRADPSPLGGLRVTVRLPAAAAPAH